MSKKKQNNPVIKKFLTPSGVQMETITIAVDRPYMNQEICVQNFDTKQYYWCSPVYRKEDEPIELEYSIDKIFEDTEAIDKWLEEKKKND
jgi:hypothetical protein